VTLKGMTAGGITTPDAHDGRLHKEKTKMAANPTHHLTIRNFPLAGQEEARHL